MKQRLLTFLLTLLPLMASANDSGSCGENATYTYDESTKTLTISGIGMMTDYSLSSPTPWYGYKNDIDEIVIEDGITTIGEWSFHDCSCKTLVIANSVTDIKKSAFYSCGQLLSITVGENVSSIETDAFSGCYSLSSLNLPISLSSIGSGAFFGCRSLSSINISRNVISIGDNAFAYCIGLVSIMVDGNNSIYDSRGNCNAIIKTSTNELLLGCGNTVIPNTILSVGANSFTGCSNLSSIVIPNGITSIGNNAFNGCVGLTSVVIPKSVNSIGINPFAGCNAIEEIQVEEGNSYYDSRDNCNAIVKTNTKTLISGCKNTIIPNTVVSIGTSAFRGCSGLTTITIPNSVETISYGAFDGCDYLTTLTLPNSVSIIDGQAFLGCTRLETVIIPQSISSIGSAAFLNCRSLTSVTVKKETPISITENVFPYRTNAILYVPVGSKSAYVEADYWKDFNDIIEIVTKRNIIYIVDGVEYKTQIVEIGSPITPEMEPSRDGYTFSGWSDIPETMPDEDVIVTGTFTVNKHHLIYKVDGEEYSNTEVDFGTALTPLVEPTRDGYTFSGWSDIPETMPDEDVIVTGTFTVNKHHLIYKVDGEEYSNTVVDFGTSITPLVEPTRDGYTFSGWSDIPETMPDEDVTISGTFSINTYELGISIENNTLGTVEYNSEVINSTSQSFSVNHGSNVSITIKPNAGNTLKWVKVDGENVKNQIENGVLTISNVTAATQVELRFVQTTTLILVSATATYCPLEDLDFSDIDDLKAYVASGFDQHSNVLTLRRVYDVKAGTGLLLMGTPNTYNVMIDETPSNYTNLLTGVTTNTMLYPINGDKANYILSSGLHGIGFYPVRRAGYISAGKAYLSLPLLGGDARQVIIVGVNENGTTGIIDTEDYAGTDGDLYNIQGQRMENPTKRGIYIKNGQKIVIK